MDEEQVRTAYAHRAAEYTALFGSVEAVDPQDLERLTAWAVGLDGPVLDVGCGPGVLTGHLAAVGVPASGIDLVPEFVDHARRAHPDVPFRLGSVRDLDLPAGALAGVLAWYSLIHLEPDELVAVLAVLHRALRPGGGLAIGFFEGERRERFAHQVVAAYRWPVDELAGALAAAGFVERSRWTRTSAGSRPHAALLAERVDRPDRS